MVIRRVIREALTYLVLLVAYGLSHAAPSDPDLWAFGADGGHRFDGNPKYLFLHVAAEHDDVRPVWLSRDPEVVADLRAEGYEARRVGSLRGLWVGLRAGYVFVSHGSGDVAWWTTGSAEVVQLWHGVPLKRLGADLDRDWSLPGLLLFALIGSNWDWLVVTGRRLAGVFAGAYGQRLARILPAGYPRNDALLREVPDATLGSDRAAHDRVSDLAAEGTLVTYMPTWREGFGEMRHGTSIAEAGFDFERLNDLLEAREAYFLLKLHPHAAFEVDVDEYDRIVRLSPGLDLYPVLDAVDVLVTDYSSVYFDYLLLDRPTVFFPYDLAEYRENPGFYFDYESVTPGPTPRTFDGFLNALDDVLAGKDDYAAERERVRDQFFDHTDAHACERVYRTFSR